MAPNAISNHGGKESPGGKGGGRFRHLLTRLPALVGLVLLIGAVLVIWRDVRHLSFHQIISGLRSIPSLSLWKGAGATLLSYGILSFYDGLACRHVRAGVSWRRSAFVAFCSYVLSHNLGCAAISGTAVRYRLYRNWGVAGGKIASIIAFCSLTYGLGMVGLVGVILLTQPALIPYVKQLPAWLVQSAGAGCFILLATYVLLPFWKKDVRLYKWRMELPNWRVGLGQILASMSDMSATALIAWCVLPPLPPGSSLTFGGFLAIYIGAYTAGLVANVPGGLGVFDSTMLLALSPWFSVPQIMGSILVFRLFYYIIPLLMAGIMFAGHELLIRGTPLLTRYGHGHFKAPSQTLRASEADFSIIVATGSQAVLGIVMVLYALVAPLPSFQSSLQAWLMQGSDFLLAIAGVVLVGLSTGLLQRVALAWRLSVAVLCLTLCILVIRHAHWGGFAVVLTVLLILVPFRSGYYREAYWRVEPFSPFILAPFSLWLCGVAGVCWIALQHHLGPIWWRVLLYGADSGVGRWVLGFSALFCLCGFWCAVRRTRLHLRPWTSDALTQYARLSPASMIPALPYNEEGLVPDGMVVDTTGKAACAVIQIDPFLLAEPVLLCLGGAVGAEGRRVSVIWRSHDYALQEGCQFAVLQYGAQYAALYASLGLEAFSLEQAEGWFLFCQAETHPALQKMLEV